MRTIRVVLLAAVAFLLGAALPIGAQEEQPALVGLPQYAVTLSGSLEDPVLENHSGRAVIGYDMRLSAAGGPGMILSAQIMAISVLPAGISDGGAIYVHGNVPVGFQRAGGVIAHSLGQGPFVRATLRSIVFGDGQFEGTDYQGAFEEFGKKLKAVREVGVLAKRHAWPLVEAFARLPPGGASPSMAGYLMYSSQRVVASLLTNGWHGVDALVAEFLAWPGDDFASSYDRLAASRLVDEQRRKGDAAGERLVEIYSSLPAPWRH